MTTPVSPTPATTPSTERTPRSRPTVVAAVVLVVLLVVALLAATAMIRNRGGDNANGSVTVDDLDDLQGTWASVNDVRAPKPLVDPVEITVDGDTISVRTGCNSGSGEVDVDDSRLVLGGNGLAVTEMGCEPPLMEQEAWVVQMVTSRPRLERSGPYLYLHWGDGERYWLGLERQAPAGA